MPSFARLTSRSARLAVALPATVLAVATIAGCGGGGSSATGTTSAAAPTSAAVAAAGGSGGTGGSAANGFAAYTACLKKNGVTIPTRASGAARPTGGARGSRVPGGGFGGLNATSGPFAAAAKACASVRPTGGFGGGGFGGGAANNSAIASELTAYRSCLSDNGVTLPSQTARPTGAPAAGASPGAGRRNGGGFGGIGALNTADPKVAAAVKKCAPLRPTFGAGGGAGAGGAGGAAPAPTATPST